MFIRFMIGNAETLLCFLSEFSEKVIIAEGQTKLGYSKEAIRLYYPLAS